MQLDQILKLRELIKIALVINQIEELSAHLLKAAGKKSKIENYFYPYRYLFFSARKLLKKIPWKSIC